jgi:putative glutamine amidotransferase
MASKHEPARQWRTDGGRPLIGITADLAELDGSKARAQCGMAYVRAVAEAGGLPMVLPPVAELAPEFASRCDAVLFTGGADARMEEFGVPTHPEARPMHPGRQAFETALLKALDSRPQTPVLGVCLGMQMMALHAGGRMNQHLPDTLPTAAEHGGDAQHRLRAVVPHAALADAGAGLVTSHHHQAVEDPGKLRVVAASEDGVIEAVDDPKRPFYLGVQWHPERTELEALGQRLFEKLVEAARKGKSC